MTETLPAGLYVVNWSVEMSNESASLGAFQCELTFSGGGNGGEVANDIVGDNGTVLGRAALSQTLTISTAASGPLTVQCESTSGTQIRAGHNEPQNLTAIAVDTVLQPVT